MTDNRGGVSSKVWNETSSLDVEMEYKQQRCIGNGLAARYKFPTQCWTAKIGSNASDGKSILYELIQRDPTLSGLWDLHEIARGDVFLTGQVVSTNLRREQKETY